MAEPSNDVRTLARPVDERKEGVAFHEQPRRARTAEPLASLCDCGIGPVPRQHRIRTLHRLVGVRHAHAGRAGLHHAGARRGACFGSGRGSGVEGAPELERVASGRAGARADRRAGCTGPTGVWRRHVFRAGYGKFRLPAGGRAAVRPVCGILPGSGRQESHPLVRPGPCRCRRLADRVRHGALGLGAGSGVLLHAGSLRALGVGRPPARHSRDLVRARGHNCRTRAVGGLLAGVSLLGMLREHRAHQRVAAVAARPGHGAAGQRSGFPSHPGFRRDRQRCVRRAVLFPAQPSAGNGVRGAVPHARAAARGGGLVRVGAVRRFRSGAVPGAVGHLLLGPAAVRVDRAAVLPPGAHAVRLYLHRVLRLQAGVGSGHLRHHAGSCRFRLRRANRHHPSGVLRVAPARGSAHRAFVALAGARCAAGAAAGRYAGERRGPFRRRLRPRGGALWADAARIGGACAAGARPQCPPHSRVAGHIRRHGAHAHHAHLSEDGDQLPAVAHGQGRRGGSGKMTEVVGFAGRAERTKRPFWDPRWKRARRHAAFLPELLGASHGLPEELIDKMKEEKGVTLDVELTAEDLKTLAGQFKAEYKEKIGEDFPADAKEQLMGAVKAVFRSWDNPRANVYRRDNDIPYSWGTAVNVQMMAFGNMGETSGTGVAFTRDPATGEKHLMGEFLMNAQGEDVVAGVRTPQKIDQLKEVMPEVYEQFVGICHTLEDHYRDMQDMEFTIEDKKLYMLQTRNGKRTAKAALKIACDLVDEGMIDEKKAVKMIDPRNLDTLLHPQFDAAALKKAEPVAKALAASPGAACGKIVFTAEDAKTWKAKGEKVVLVRLETSPEDIEGMKAAQGILTVRGGMTSHAAVVARGMGTCCVSGCGDIAMDEENKKFTLAGKEFHEGDYISIDGTTGNIYDGAIKTVDATIAGEFGRVMAWADKYRTLKVRTNADTPADAKKARELGAEGIGLCRTEHMFFEEDRIAAFREMICSDTVEEREAALEKILPYQQGDFEALYEALEGNPVTIRFLDPPLHEFVPTEEADIEKLAKAQGKSVETIKNIIASLHEFNPMMGHRGCRLAVTYPEIAKMQTKAVIRAAINVQKKHSDWTVKPEIMIPLVCEVKELKYVKKVVVETADAEIAAAGVKLEYEVGTMIEIPRAALTADEIATEADFFCFGTNDLTQMTFGFSRDDAGKFLNAYYDTKIFENDPFAKLDQNGVGKLMDMAIKLGKPVNPKLHVGICGEHGGDPSSVEFCHKIGLDYVSCSPFRVPIARLAAAQAAISNK